MKVYGNPLLSKSVGTIFSNSICSLCVFVLHFGNSWNISNIFIIICYGDLWSVIFVTIGIVWGTMNCAYVRQPADKLFMKGGINLGGKFHCCLILRNCHMYPESSHSNRCRCGAHQHGGLTVYSYFADLKGNKDFRSYWTLCVSQF